MARLMQKWLSVITGIWLLVVLQRYWARQGAQRVRRSVEVVAPLDGPRWHGNESIVVAGAAGFLGMHLVEELQKANVPLLPVDHVTFVEVEKESLRRKRTAHMDKTMHVRLRKANICNKDSLKGFLEKSNATHLVYVAIDETDTEGLAIGDHVRRHLSCVQAAVDAAVAGEAHLTVVTTNALGSTEESSNLRRAMSQAGEGLLWAAHKEHGLRASLVQIEAEMFGPWEHPDMTASTWYYAMQQGAAIMSEVSGKGMLYVQDVAREVAHMVAESEHWDRWTIDQHTFEYNNIYSYLLHNVTNGTQAHTLLPPPVMAEATPRHTREVGKGPMAMRRLKDPRRTALNDAMRPFLKWMETNTETLAEVSIKTDTYFREWVKRELERKEQYQEVAKNKWLQFATSKGIKMPYSDGSHTYTFYPGKYSIGQPINVVGIYEDVVDEIKEACNEDMYCIGFSSDGLMLARIMPYANWDTKPYKAKDKYGPEDGLYVADDVDLCIHSSLHKCPGEAKCVFEGAGRYRCECKEGLELTPDNRCEPKRRRMDILPSFLKQHNIGRLLMQKAAGLALNAVSNEVEDEKKEDGVARGLLAEIGMVNDEKTEGEMKEMNEERTDERDEGEAAVVEEERIERKEDEKEEEVLSSEEVIDGGEDEKEVEKVEGKEEKEVETEQGKEEKEVEMEEGKEERDVETEKGEESEGAAEGEKNEKDLIETADESNEESKEEARDSLDGKHLGKFEKSEGEVKEGNHDMQEEEEVMVPIIVNEKVERHEEREEGSEDEGEKKEEEAVFGPQLDNAVAAPETGKLANKEENVGVDIVEIVNALLEDGKENEIEPALVVEGKSEREEENEDGGVEDGSEERAVDVLEIAGDVDGDKNEGTDETEDIVVGVDVAEVVNKEEGALKGVQAPLGGWVDLVMCTDAAQAKGVAVVIKSALDNMKQPERLRVHVVTGRQDAPGLAHNLGCYGFDVAPLDGSATDGYQVTVVPFDEDSVKGMYRVHTSTAVTGNLGSALNFARFYLATLLPTVRRAVYLDVDTVVKGDLGQLSGDAYGQMDSNPNMLLAVAQRLPNRPMSKQVHKVYTERYGKDFDERDMVQYNAGVFVVDLARWREQKLTEEAEFWMRETTRQKLWDYGSQPVMYMCCHGRTLAIDGRWNVDGLGWNTLPANRIAEAKILHWSGKSKPWEENPPNRYRDLWLKHMPDYSCRMAAENA